MHALADMRFTCQNREDAIERRLDAMSASDEHKARCAWLSESSPGLFSDYLYARIAREVDSDITDAMEIAA